MVMSFIIPLHDLIITKEATLQMMYVMVNKISQNQNVRKESLRRPNPTKRQIKIDKFLSLLVRFIVVWLSSYEHISAHDHAVKHSLINS